MTTITINSKLKADTFELGELKGQTLLLMNNSLLPWFIILPNTQETELFKLDKAERNKLEQEIDQRKFEPTISLRIASRIIESTSRYTSWIKS